MKLLNKEYRNEKKILAKKEYEDRKKRYESLSIENKKKFSRMNFFNKFFGLIVIILLLVLLQVNFKIANVPSESMYPTLGINELVIAKKISKPESLTYGDIVIFKPYADTQPKLLYIKRLIGKPGDTIEVKIDGVYRNGEKIKEDYRYEAFTGQGGTMKPTIIPDGEYFFMGDNWNNSKDSRVFGTIPFEDIVGKMIFNCNPIGDKNINIFMNSISNENINPDFKK